MSVRIFEIDGHDKMATIRSLHRMRRAKNSLAGLHAFGDLLDDAGICGQIGETGCSVVRGILAQMGIPLNTDAIRAKVQQMGKDRFCNEVVKLAPDSQKGIAAAACSQIVNWVMSKVDGGGSSGGGGTTRPTLSIGDRARFKTDTGFEHEKEMTITTAGWKCQDGKATCVVAHVVGPAVKVGSPLPLSRCLTLKNPSDLKAGIPNPRPLPPPNCKSKVLPIAIGAGALLVAGIIAFR